MDGWIPKWNRAFVTFLLSLAFCLPPLFCHSVCTYCYGGCRCLVERWHRGCSSKLQGIERQVRAAPQAKCNALWENAGTSWSNVFGEVVSESRTCYMVQSYTEHTFTVYNILK